MAAAAKRQTAKQQELQVEEFAVVQGMETREQRDAIQPGFWSWLMNFQPIGRRTLRVLMGKATDIYTLTGDTVTNGRTYIIGDTYYAVLFTLAGAAYQINLATGAPATIGTAATFWNGSGAYPHSVDFGNSGILIVSPLGYWAWDGTTLFAAGDQSPSWLNGLLPTLSTTGTTHGTNVIDGLASTTNVVVGIGVYAADIPAGATVLAINSPSSVTISIAATGSNVAEPIVFSFLPSLGDTHTNTTVDNLASTVNIQVGMAAIAADIPAGATVIAIASATSVTLSLPATGSNTQENIVFTWLMPQGIVGTAIEIYNASPWIVNGRTILASSPGNGANFAASAGGVSLTVKDSYVQDGYSGLKQLDGFLYLFAHGAVDVISDVSTSGSPPTTTFLRINVSPKIGTPWRDTIVSLPSSIVCTNKTGCYEVTGGQLRKISDSFDGVFEDATYPPASSDPSGFHPSACIVTLNETVCYAVTIRLPDPDDINQVFVPCLATWDGRRWFLTTQESQPNVVFEQDSDSVLIGWASTGTEFFSMFSQASPSLNKKAKSWLTASKSGITWRKEIERIYAQFANVPIDAPFSKLTIDTDTKSIQITSINTPSSITFVGTGPIQFTGAMGADIFFSGAYPLVVAGAPPYGGGIICILFGFTMESTIATLDVVSVNIGYVDYSRWQ